MTPGTLYIVTASLAGPIRRIGFVLDRKAYIAGYVYGCEMHFLPSGELDGLQPNCLRKREDITELAPVAPAAGDRDPTVSSWATWLQEKQQVEAGRTLELREASHGA